VHFLLREIDRDVPAEGVRKWNILDAMQGVSMAWESIVPAVIQNCFAKCGFSTANSDNTDSDEENCKWVELQSHIGCSSTFEELLNVNKSVPTSIDQPKSLDVSGPNWKHVVGEEGEKMEEIRLFEVV
jgi:hypothetical protein